MVFTVTVEPSSHPDFELFAKVNIYDGQCVMHGSESEIQEWYDKLDILVRAHGDELALINK